MDGKMGKIHIKMEFLNPTSGNNTDLLWRGRDPNIAKKQKLKY